VKRFLLISSMVWCTHGHAHSWYDLSCCGDNHCHPVPDNIVSDTKDGVYVQGFGILSYSDARLHWSHDDHDHVCISDSKLICVYRKPSQF
jgi:hypothetical protein